MALRGLFVYGYSVQGYSDLSKVPAYYGLVWLTPQVITGALVSTIVRKLPENFQVRLTLCVYAACALPPMSCVCVYA
jgi:hypothetical protein